MHECVCSYRELTQKKFAITYGKQGIKTELILVFSDEDFYHLAGLRYLKDFENELHTYDRIDIFEKLYNNKEYCDRLVKSNFYENIESRIDLVKNLHEILLGEFNLFNANKQNLSRQNCRIPCDYIIRIKRHNKVAFLFLKETDDAFYVANSIFYNRRQLVYGQRPLAILEKKFIY